MTQPVADAHDRTVRWRQLVDLLSRPHDELDPALLDAALTMVRTGMKSIARPIRAATSRSIAGRAAEPRLIAIFAGDRLEVAAPLLAAAPLDEAGWATVLASASAEVADFVRTIRGDVALSAQPAADAPPIGEGSAPLDDPTPSIGEMVARIERLKSKRDLPPAAGEERVEMVPAFSPVDGRFLGYRGIARREGARDEAPPTSVLGVAAGDAEALRETIHEIKTPLNAIIGFAEIIDGQYLGPAHRSYRLRAAEIVTQARTLLVAIEDLDFAARLQGRRPGDGELAAIADLLPPLAEEWASQALARGVQLRIAPLTSHLRSRLDRDLATRLLKRFIGAVVDAAAANELIHVDAEESKGRLSFAATRPTATAHLGEAQLLDPSFAIGSEGEASRLGLGFALRLVRGLARLAGGDLKVAQADLTLILPLSRG